MCPNCTTMRYLLLSSLLALGLTASSQIPDYVPTDGLAAWYPFSGNADDAGMNGYDGTSVGVAFVEDRHNVDNSAIRCGYPDSPTWVELPQSLQTSSMDFTLSFWLKPASVSGRSEVVSRDQDPQDDGDWSFFIEDGVLFFETRIGNGPTNFVSGGMVETSSWSNVVVRRSASTGENQIYLNGLLVATAEEFYGSLNPSNPIHIGRHAVVASNFYQGDFDDFGIWNRALSLEEISSLNTGEQPVFGCTNDNACNFNPEANVDDGSCLDCALFEERCGPGTMWDETAQLCVVANPSDTDFDGCVGMTDLLDLLSVFGTCNETPWSCGDPLEYQGYDYETVQIGEQCWFAEDLRSTHFLDGSPIPSLQDTGGNWTDLTEPAYGYYEMENWISDETPLFNHFVVQDDRGVCPSGWKVPAIEDMPVGSPNGVWPNLEYRGYINADPANPLFMGGGFEVWYWSETIEDDRAYDIGIWSFDDHIVSGHHIYQYGFSIRCIQDSE